ncbi:fluoride efflux transporter FluC [Actinomycetospora straminea]|uniref:Fluoride-specific ion channel FluC n=1 Tax=Actinomycetospora straminea TaxID=663607 RepID=A0ABP9EKD6_9PSEU|nr:CrcB family protein [Actinomycetospora straminea]MDD7935116.1 CrcB family protein [Actinomycetospora straminea]
MTALLVALGAAVGAPVRYLAGRLLTPARAGAVPWGTAAVNVGASFVLGLVLGGPAPPGVVALVGVGFCGALSTWSTLAVETVRLIQERARATGVVYVLGSTLAGLGAAALGLALGT